MEGELQQILGRNLRAVRAASGLTQEEFADLLGIHRTYIGGLERGERNVTLQTVERLAASLKVTAIALLDGTAAGPPPPSATGKAHTPGAPSDRRRR